MFINKLLIMITRIIFAKLVELTSIDPEVTSLYSGPESPILQ